MAGSNNAMTDREIAAYLRGATRDKLVIGWKPVAGKWIVNTLGGCGPAWERAEVLKYVWMLAEAGVEPEFVRHDP